MEASREEFERILRMVPSMRAMSAERCDELYEQFQEFERACSASPSEFFKYRLYERSDAEAGQFLMRKQYAQLCGCVNDPVVSSGLVDRVAFNREYAPYLMRNWTYGSPENREKFYQLCENNKRLAYKARKGSGGRGFSVVYTADKVWLWEDMLAEEALVEELLVQHQSLSELFANSVNTVRIYTALGAEGDLQLIASVLRCGRGRMISDCGEGLCAKVDLETGKVVGEGVSRAQEHFDCHPNTGLPFVGLTLPNWSQLLNKAGDVALRRPELRLMSWDWTCRKDGAWCLLGGNFAGGMGPCQEAADRGFKEDVYQALEMEEQ